MDDVALGGSHYVAGASPKPAWPVLLPAGRGRVMRPTMMDSSPAAAQASRACFANPVRRERPIVDTECPPRCPGCL